MEGISAEMPTWELSAVDISVWLAGNVEDAGKAAQVNLAQCIAALCQASGPQKTATTVQSLLAVLQVCKLTPV